MADAHVNKVTVNGKTVLALSGDTVYQGMLAKGITAHDKSGAKITGTLDVPATEERAVELSMPSGDQVIQPTSGKVMRKVTVQKPATLLPENIKEDVVIGGVTGTMEDGSGKYLPLTGGTLTGNLYGKYFSGTWLQATEASNLGKTPPYIAVLDGSGWVYKRTPAEILKDIGAPTITVVGNTLKIGG